MVSNNRMFNGKPVRRLIVSVELETVEAVDKHLSNGYPWRAGGNRSEFVRLAIEERLRRLTNIDNQPTKV